MATKHKIGKFGDRIDEEFRVLEERLAMPAASETRESLTALFAPEFREFGVDGRISMGVPPLLESLVSGRALRVLLGNFMQCGVGVDTVFGPIKPRVFQAPAGSCRRYAVCFGSCEQKAGS